MKDLQALLAGLSEGLLIGNICAIQYIIEIYSVQRNREAMEKRMVLFRSPIPHCLDSL